MILYGQSRSESIPSDRTNIFRSELFVQFPNLVEIEMDTMESALTFLSLLSVLDEANIPDCFKMLKLSDYTQEWMKEAFLAIPNIAEQFAAKNWNVKVHDDEEWIIITRV